MGLDILDLIFVIEREFNIEMSDEETCQSDTVGKLYQCVLDKTEIAAGNQYSSQKAFETLRKSLQENISIEEEIIKPETITELVFPKAQRKILWQKVSSNVPYKFPELIYPRKLSIFILVFALLNGIICSYFLCRYMYIPCISVVAWIPLTVILSIVLYKSLQSFKLVIPFGCDTLEGLAKNILYHNGQYFGILSKEEIWDKFTYIISEQLGVKQENIKPESNFIKDFNI